MQEQMYIVIGATDDGTYIESLSKAELEERINGEYYGAVSRLTYLTEIPNISIDEWLANSILIIRASAFVVPRAVEVVTRRTID